MPTRDRSAQPADPAERTRRQFARRQWARRWLAWRRVLIGLLLIGLVAGGVYLVQFSSVLSVHGVQVTGTQSLDPRAVRRAARVSLGEPLATTNLGAIGARVEGLAAVKSVDVSRSWPDRVRIAVVERQAVAVVQRGNGLRGVDEEGVLFRRYLSRPASLPLLRQGASTRTDALAEAARVAAALPPALAKRVASVDVRTVDTISLRMRSGRTVRWGSADGSADKARVLVVLLKQKASFYDVSVPGQPIVRR